MSENQFQDRRCFRIYQYDLYLNNLFVQYRISQQQIAIFKVKQLVIKILQRLIINTFQSNQKTSSFLGTMNFDEDPLVTNNYPKPLKSNNPIANSKDDYAKPWNANGPVVVDTKNNAKLWIGNNQRVVVTKSQQNHTQYQRFYPPLTTQITQQNNLSSIYHNQAQLNVSRSFKPYGISQRPGSAIQGSFQKKSQKPFMQISPNHQQQYQNVMKITQGKIDQSASHDKRPYSSQTNLSNQSFGNQIVIPLNLMRQLLDQLKAGNFENFITNLQPCTVGKKQINQMIQELKNVFKEQIKFYNLIKSAVTGGDDSRMLYADKRFFFFEQIPSLLNKIVTKLADKFKIKLDYGLNLQLKKSITDRYQKVFQSLTQVTENVEQMIEKVKSYQSLALQDEETIKKLQKKIKQMEKIMTVLKLSQDNPQQDSSYEIQSLKYKIKSLEHENHFFPIQKKELQDQIYTLKRQADRLKAQKIDIKPPSADFSEINSLKKLNQQLLLDNQKLLIQLRNNSKRNDEKVIEYEKQINFLKQTIKSAQIKMLENQQRIKDMAKVPKIVQQNPSKYILQSSQILDYYDENMKSRLTNMLIHSMSLKPIQFRLLYKFDKNVTSSFQTYIYGKKNILLLVKLTNGEVIGGFCPAVYQKGSKPTAGFIFSLTQDKFYSVKQNGTCMSYQEYYLVFGNSQIRIQINSEIMYSNFGISNGFFQNGEDKVSNFLYGNSSKNEVGQVDRNVQMKGYEIYEVNFTK